MNTVEPTGQYDPSERPVLHVSHGKGNTPNHQEVHIDVQVGDRVVARGWYRRADLEREIAAGPIRVTEGAAL